MAELFEASENHPRPYWFAGADPADRPLGSGGGTTHLLVEAWRATASGKSFAEWLKSSRKLILHAGGQSRRLPSYAPIGKLLMPMPVFRWARGQRLDQSLLDLQLPDYEWVLNHAGPGVVAMVASGDVLLRFSRQLPSFPQVDVLGLGMWVSPEKAKDFGVFFSRRNAPGELSFFFQKPTAERIRGLADEYLPLVDTGMWLLSERAVAALMKRSGWEPGKECFKTGSPAHYELYSQFGLCLGHVPTLQDPELNALSCAVVALPQAQFYHFGTTSQMIESVASLQTLELDETKVGAIRARNQPDQVTLNSTFCAALKRGENKNLWVESSVVPSSWRIASNHAITGVPPNQWELTLPDGACLDFVPIGETGFAVRNYGYQDSFSGPIGSPSTCWMTAPAIKWFNQRGLNPETCGLGLQVDIQHAKLFPVLEPGEIQGEFVQWLCALEPEPNAAYTQLWESAQRLAASEISAQANLHRLFQQRAKLRAGCIEPMLRNHRSSVIYRLDLESTAQEYARTGAAVPELDFASQEDPLELVHDQMFRSAVLRHHNSPDWKRYEANAFARLRELIIKEAQLSPALPHCDVLEDQIVWARSPVRLDLAGGWTDTPPYCIESGGKVVNIAVDLNGQPPIQVFARLSSSPELVMRSIDLGVEERVRTYAELDSFARPESPFALAKAAFALAGFLPRFHANAGAASLEQQLRDFGSGIELSLLSAIPKGSGLGTSSILAATVLAALSDLCGLNWDRNVLFTRTLALEQMLTTGGGWQDQAGAIFGGIKLIETAAGLAQKPTIRWLPSRLFDRDHANRCILLYYTGITRLAKNILAEIVRGIFLNAPSRLRVISEIATNCDLACAALQLCDYTMLTDAIRNSWELNQALDSGTNPPEVQRILHGVHDHLLTAKLLGAGGGGYLLMMARDEAAAQCVKQSLLNNPPNSKARFVDFSLSESGLHVTRS